MLIECFLNDGDKMKVFESKFTVLTIFFAGVVFGALFGFWTTLGMVIASELAVMAYRYYVSSKFKDTVVDETVDTQTA